jgi:hypothetical protein
MGYMHYTARVETKSEIIYRPRLLRQDHKRASEKGAGKRWIIMACRQDEDVVLWILDRAESLRVNFCRIIWATDNGPIRFFGSAEELRDYFSCDASS